MFAQTIEWLCRSGHNGQDRFLQSYLGSFRKLQNQVIHTYSTHSCIYIHKYIHIHIHIHIRHVMNRRKWWFSPSHTFINSRNNNSSRFGKLVNLEFDEKKVLIGCTMKRWVCLYICLYGMYVFMFICTEMYYVCIRYLLESARVVKQQSNERNFHIFYQVRCLYACSVYMYVCMYVLCIWMKCLFSYLRTNSLIF